MGAEFGLPYFKFFSQRGGSPLHGPDGVPGSRMSGDRPCQGPQVLEPPLGGDLPLRLGKPRQREHPARPTPRKRYPR